MKAYIIPQTIAHTVSVMLMQTTSPVDPGYQPLINQGGGYNPGQAL